MSPWAEEIASRLKNRRPRSYCESRYLKVDSLSKHRLCTWAPPFAKHPQFLLIGWMLYKMMYKENWKARGSHKSHKRPPVLFPLRELRRPSRQLVPICLICEDSSSKNQSFRPFHSQWKIRQHLPTSDYLSFPADGFPFLDMSPLIFMKVVFCCGVHPEF